MGQFNVTVTAVGNHGCQREIKDGGDVEGCGNAGCTDCITREYLAKLKDKGSSVEVAKITHWPGTAGEVQDDLVTKKRTGSF